MMVEPESGSEVFAPFSTTQSSAGNSFGSYYFGFNPDFVLQKATSGTSSYTGSRLTGTKYMNTDSTSAELTTSSWQWDLSMDSAVQYSPSYGVYGFKRAKGFFDVVAYTGTGSAHTEKHSLGVVPEMMIVKNRSATDWWRVYSSTTGSGKHMPLNDNQSQYTSSTTWNNTSPTASVFTIGTEVNVNTNNENFIAYLFATLDGVSKVGSYTGNGSNQNIACGFSAGARFVLIKRYNGSSDWFIWDTERGIVTGNDPHLSLNTTAAEVTTDDSIDPHSAGFTVNESSGTYINSSGGTYIFLAIA
jgi:hypothetical protein